MHTVLVTGGSGDLGRHLIPELTAAGYTPRVLSRQPAPAGAQPPFGTPGPEWATGDFATGAGLDAALAGVQTIIHAASSPMRQTWEVDVEGTRRFLERARAAGVAHFVYISIVGIDRIPYAYYKAKLAAEEVVTGGGVPWTILRATQFHRLLDRMLGGLPRFPVTFLPTDFKFQLVDTGEVAAAMVAALAGGPAGRLPDMGGPEVLTLGEIARAWLTAHKRTPRVWHLPLPGAIAAGFRAGLNTCPQNRQGKITWQEWLARQTGGSK